MASRAAQVRDEINKFKVGAPARVGLVAPNDVVVPLGNTGLDPSQTSFFQARARLSPPRGIADLQCLGTGELGVLSTGTNWSFADARSVRGVQARQGWRVPVSTALAAYQGRTHVASGCISTGCSAGCISTVLPPARLKRPGLAC
jgi:hypothetical protein